MTRDAVHVWRVDVAHERARFEYLWSVASDAERARAQRFHFERDRVRFVICRGVLREVLASCMGAEPARVDFEHGPHGKPHVRDRPDAIEFNLSHSGGFGLIAVGRGRRVGVDVEEMRQSIEIADIARHFFSPRECDVLLALPEPQQITGFYNCWTRKEGWLKATGDGITERLQSFAVSLRPGEPAALEHVDGEPDAASQWMLRDLAVAEGYAAVVVGEGRDWRLVLEGEWAPTLQGA